MSGLCEPEQHNLEKTVKQILRIQVVAGVVAMVVLWVVSTAGDTGHALDSLTAALYGSLLPIIGTMISARSAQRSSRIAATGSNMAMVPIFSGLMLKLGIMGGGIGVGLVFLSLDAMPLLVSFAIVKMSSVFSMLPHLLVKN